MVHYYFGAIVTECIVRKVPTLVNVSELIKDLNETISIPTGMIFKRDATFRNMLCVRHIQAECVTLYVAFKRIKHAQIES